MMWAKALVCAALMTSAAGCYKVTYENPGTMPSGQVVSEKGWFFIEGLIGEKEIWANKACPIGVHQVQSKTSFLDLIITGLTGGIIAPRSYDIECGK
jgi:hypothetical protein